MSKSTGRPAAGEWTFLAEHLWPGVTQEAATARVERLALTTEELRRAGRPIGYLRSSLIPEDETVFNWFRAASRTDVTAVGDRAGIPFDRIVLVTDLPCPVPPAPD